ncbi:MAG: NAD-dependent epimerase/dehydratase family protein, partial [Candidatus Dadabacteria bacterium]|nr:NAD-dependent epimerase/dehydratase family protein [Candidatus Dadabacteria bacterium]NIQ13842.1 NAD-dependent epimerase/dehydratase family protein [Candidatus Dadabacteria bacterium]
DVKPDITFNLIGYGVSQKERDEDLMWKINSSLPGEITQTISEDKKSSHQMIRLIHVGSGFEYGTIENEITESTIPNPKTIYGKSKLAGTKKVCEISCKTGLPALTARLFTVYGPGEEEPRLFPSLVRISKTQESLNLTGGEQERDFTFVKDAAMGLLKLGILKNVPGPIINVATGTLLKVKDFALCAANLMGIPED